MPKRHYPSRGQIRTEYDPPDDSLIPEPLNVTPKKTKPQSSSAVDTGLAALSEGSAKLVTVSPAIRERQQILLRKTGAGTAEERANLHRYDGGTTMRTVTEGMVPPTTVGGLADNLPPPGTTKTGSGSDQSAAETGTNHGAALATGRVPPDTLTEKLTNMEQKQLQMASSLVNIENRLGRLVAVIETLSQDIAAMDSRMTG